MTSSTPPSRRSVSSTSTASTKETSDRDQIRPPLRGRALDTLERGRHALPHADTKGRDSALCVPSA